MKALFVAAVGFSLCCQAMGQLLVTDEKASEAAYFAAMVKWHEDVAKLEDQIRRGNISRLAPLPKQPVASDYIIVRRQPSSIVKTETSTINGVDAEKFKQAYKAEGEKQVVAMNAAWQESERQRVANEKKVAEAKAAAAEAARRSREATAQAAAIRKQAEMNRLLQERREVEERRISQQNQEAELIRIRMELERMQWDERNREMDCELHRK